MIIKIQKFAFVNNESKETIPITKISSTLTNFGSSRSESLIRKQLFAL